MSGVRSIAAGLVRRPKQFHALQREYQRQPDVCRKGNAVCLSQQIKCAIDRSQPACAPFPSRWIEYWTERLDKLIDGVDLNENFLVQLLDVSIKSAGRELRVTP
jgi:hypothetical protein